MTEPTARERKLERALLDLSVFAVVFATGRGMKPARRQLMASIMRANELLDSKPCQRDAEPTLHDLADAADEERRSDPSYRADLDG